MAAQLTTTSGLSLRGLLKCSDRAISSLPVPLSPVSKTLAELWLYRLACQWKRISQEEAFMGRCADVGDELGMGRKQRFHLIHADALDMDCSQCHVEEAPYELAQPYSEEVDPVDRRVCLGCHLTGPATKLYEPKE